MFNLFGYFKNSVCEIYLEYMKYNNIMVYFINYYLLIIIIYKNLVIH